MAKHLSERDVEAIVNLVRGWSSEKLTWQGVCSAAAKLLGREPTRQTLHRHEAIKAAYAAKKSGLKVHGPRVATPSSLAIAAQRIARLQSINDELVQKNSALLEQFVRWQYNAYKHGLKEHQLNEDLPPIDRERTEVQK